MALTELIFGAPTKVKVGVVQLDASISETHNDEVEITEHPVELGSDIVDHIRKRPITLELNGLVTNTPVVFLASLFGGSPVEGDFLPSSDRVNRAYDELRKIQEDGEVVDVVTSLREYSDMAISSISISRDATTGQVLNATLSLREVKFAKALAVDLPLIDEVARKAKDTSGKVPKTEASPAQAGTAENSSIFWKAGLGALGT